MKAVDANGVVYTYNSELGAWLMPELEALRLNDFQIQLENNFDFEAGSVLSTVALAGVIDPTQVGKVIIVGVGITIFLYTVYQFAIADVSDADWDICYRLWKLCYARSTTKYACRDCETICRENRGVWPNTQDRCKIPGIFN